MANTKTQQKKKWPIVLLGVLLAVLVAASALLLTKCNGEEPPVNKLTGELTQALAQEGDGIIELEENVVIDGQLVVNGNKTITGNGTILLNAPHGRHLARSGEALLGYRLR